MDEPEPEYESDPFAALIAANCRVTASQEDVLRAASLARHRERFPGEPKSQFRIPVETTEIRMESPPEDEFLTPQEDSLPPASSPEPPPPPALNEESVDASGGTTGTAVDLGRDSDSLGFGLAKSTVVIESGTGTEELVCSTDEFMVVERETRRMREEEALTEVEVKKFKISEGFTDFKGASIGTMVVDWDGDQVFDKRPVRNQGVKRDRREDFGIEAADLGEHRDFLVRKRGLKMGSSENTDTAVVDLEDHDLPVLNEKTSTQVMDLDEDEARGNNREAEICPSENISTEVVDVDENGACDDLPIRNRQAEMGSTVDTDTEVIDLDEHELCGDLITRNLVHKVGASEGDEVRRDVNRALSKKVVGPNNNENCQKGMGIGESREQHDDLPQRDRVMEYALDKGAEPCRDESGEFAGKVVGKGVQGVDKFKPAQKGISIGESHEMSGDLPLRNREVENSHNKGAELCRAGNREFAKKGIELPKVDDIRQKGKGVVGSRELPSSLRMLADSALNEGIGPNEETRRGPVETNRSKIDKSKGVGQMSRASGALRDLPSSINGKSKSDQIMKKLLDALDLIIEDKEEEDNDASVEEFDIWETAMKRGLKFPHPRWWPLEESDD